jgi:hypothetical protein
MTPQPQTKTNALCAQLWAILLHDDVLPKFTLARLHREADSLHGVNWYGHIWAKGILAAIENNEKELLHLADIIFATEADAFIFLNWSNLFVQFGYIDEAYAFAKKSWAKDRGDSRCIEAVINLSSAVNDLETFEASITAWHKLHPSHVHPLVYAWMLETQVNADVSESERENFFAENLSQMLASVPKAISTHPRSARLKRHISELLGRVEP